MDLVDFILSDASELDTHPDFGVLYDELTIGALDYAEDRLREFRERDRLADVLADPNWRSWCAGPMDREPREGERLVIEGRVVTVTNVSEDRFGRRYVHIDGDRVIAQGATVHRWLPIPVDGATLGTRPSA